MDELPGGVLYLVATPIGNLADMTMRAVETLREVDVVACEDTRHSKILFERHAIRPQRLTPYHAHNLDRQTPLLLAELTAGRSVALISDAGTPGISDPGARLAAEAVASGIRVSPIPGSSAPLLALTASGFPTHRFIFEGFLPRKKGRKTLFTSWIDEERTIIFFESPLRVVKSLSDIRKIVGNRPVVVGREMTKKFEEFIRGDLESVAAELKSRPSVKGEITVVLRRPFASRD